MPLKLKNLSEQVVVVTGATSGIGLATALMAAARGAKLVLASRSEDELRDLVSQIRQKNSDAIYVVADLANIEQVDELARRTQMEFGRVDSWINNCSTSIFGKLLDTSMEEKRRLFDVNFWGAVHGCRAAVKLMKKQGGAVINVGSVLSDRSIPVQGIYSATNYAVKAYTDTLRMELEAEQIPISVSLVKPASIDTPFTERSTAALYDDELVARAILNCCESPQKDVFVGGNGKTNSFLETHVPQLTDYLMEKILIDQSEEKTSRSHASVGKSAVVAAGLGVAAFAAFKVYRNSRRPGEATH